MNRIIDTSLLSVLVVAGALAVGLMGCSGGAAAQQSASSAPNWFLNPDEAYSENMYLTAVASASSAQAAQNQAFGNLARIFEADIQASQELRDEYEEVQQSGDVTQSRQETRMITRSDVQSNQKLLNSEVLEQQQVGDTYYALVGMERQETVSIYSQEIESNRSKVEDYRATAKETDNPITRLAFLQKALVIAKVNERLVTQRNIVAGGSAPSSASSPVTALETSVREAQAACPVVVQAGSDDIPSSIVDQVGATLETAGFRVVDEGGDAVLEALVKYDERPALESRDEEFLRWTLAIELTDRTIQQTLETFTTEQRAGAMSEAAVKRRAHNGARRAVENDFSAFLNQTLLNIDQ
jgi:hypothetical protein